MAGVRGWAHQTYRCGKIVRWELQQDDMRARYRNARGKRNLSSRLQLVLALLLAGFALTAVTRRYRSKPQEAAQKEGTAKSSWTPTWLWGSEPKQEQWPETLVVYIFSNTDPESFNNLKFFLKWGVREGDGAYYIIVVQEGGKSPVSPHLALTPVNLWLLCLELPRFRRGLRWHQLDVMSGYLTL